MRVFSEPLKNATNQKKIVYEDSFDSQDKVGSKRLEIFGKCPGFASLSDYRNNIMIKTNKGYTEETTLEISNLPISFLNSIRRILMGEVSSIAIEKVFIFNNSSVIPDELIVQRLGMVPFISPPDFLNFFKNTGYFNNMKIVAVLKKSLSDGHSKKCSVYSSSLKIKKHGLLYSMNKNFCLKPAYRDILLFKLGPGQKIKCECHFRIGMGLENAKFSPVAATFYRINPKIKILGEVYGTQAKTLFKLCPVRVFDMGRSFGKSKKKIIVSNPQFCTLCRGCLSIKEKNLGLIKLGRMKNSMTFVVESSGISSAENLFFRAVQLLIGKCGNSLMKMYQKFSLREKEKIF